MTYAGDRYHVRLLVRDQLAVESSILSGPRESFNAQRVRPEGSVQVHVLGAVWKESTVDVPADGSLLEAIRGAGGFIPLSVSQFRVFRGDRCVELKFGDGLAFAPETEMLLSLFRVEEGDVVLVFDRTH